MQWETVIGLEIHVQLSTRSKIFSGASVAYGAPPNSQACAVDIALPGVLPVLNRKAVEYAIRFGMAIGATINSPAIFARKTISILIYPKAIKSANWNIRSLQVGVSSYEPKIKKNHTPDTRPSGRRCRQVYTRRIS